MYRKTILSNGIRVVTERIPHVNSVSVGIWVKTGSRDELQEENGISHFIEHMLFKGTERRSALEIAREIDSVGGVLNASTSREFTNFYAKVLNKDFDLAFDLLSDIFLNSLFPSEEIEREREVIFQEISMVEDTPDEYVQDLFSQHFFAGHPLGFPILGNYRSVGQISKPTITEWFRTAFLRPGRIVVSVAGKLEHRRVVELIDASLGRLAPQKEDRVLAEPEINAQIHVFSKDLEQVHLCMGSKAVSQTHPLRYAAYVLNTVLGGSMSSRLFQEVREKRGLAYAVFSYISSYADTGMLTVYAGTTRDKVNEVIALVMAELRNLKKKPLEAHELSKAKEQLKGNILLAWESTDARMSRLAKGELYFNKFISLKELLQGIDGVSKEDVQNLAQIIFQKSLFSLAALGKIGKEDIPVELVAL